MLERTQVLVLPAWIYRVKHHATKIYLRDTPFCAAKSATELTDEFGPSAVVTCLGLNTKTDGCYPLAKMQALQVP